MGLKRAGTVSAGALAFMTIAIGPSSAQVPDRPADRCELGGLLCGVLRDLRPPAAPRPSPRTRPHRPDTGSRRHADPPPHRVRVPPAGDEPVIRPVGDPAGLPDVSRQLPVVVPRSAPAPPAPPAPVAVPAEVAIPPLPVAAASCIIGVLATVHLSVLARRLRRDP